MLTIQPTESLTGLTVSGDHWYLDDSIKSIHEIVGEEKHYFYYEVELALKYPNDNAIIYSFLNKDESEPNF